MSDNHTKTTVRLRYFAWLRQMTGMSQEDIQLPDDLETTADLMAWLQTRNENFAKAFANPDTVRVALDQVYASHDESLQGIKEIAFFPPVTGG